MTVPQTMPFCRYDLRTTDAEAARAFYTEVIGLEFGATSPEDPSPLAVWPLHEQALARGAAPHWLGQVAVADVDAMAARLATRGSERLGPTLRGADGTAFAMLRDPFGALLAVRDATQRPRRVPVVWHQLHTRDLEGSWAAYSELFGWVHTETIDVTDPPGGYRVFAWDGAGKRVGSVGNTARAPGVHPHWTFFFPVADLDERMIQVRAHGGIVGSPAVRPNGDRLVPCDDPQGAAFGLYQRA